MPASHEGPHQPPVHRPGRDRLDDSTPIHREKFRPGSVGGAPSSRKLKWLASCHANLPINAPFCPPPSLSVRTPSTSEDEPAMVIGGLPEPDVVQVKLPSSWRLR